MSWYPNNEYKINSYFSWRHNKRHRMICAQTPCLQYFLPSRYERIRALQVITAQGHLWSQRWNHNTPWAFTARRHSWKLTEHCDWVQRVPSVNSSTQARNLSIVLVGIECPKKCVTNVFFQGLSPSNGVNNRPRLKIETLVNRRFTNLWTKRTSHRWRLINAI